MVKIEDLDRVTFYRAIRECDTEDELKALIHDLLSKTEIENVQDRWNIAQSKLGTNCSNNVLKKYHKVSLELINRVVQELNPEINPVGDNGYRRVYRRIFGDPEDEK